MEVFLSVVNRQPPILLKTLYTETTLCSEVASLCSEVDRVEYPPHRLCR
jgi:hypothetical protein